MAEQGAHDPRVRDDGDVGKVRVERSGKRLGAGKERGDGLATGRDEAENVLGPGVELPALDRIPALPFPGAEVDFAETGVDPDMLRQRFGEAAGATERAAEYRNTRRKYPPEFSGDRIDLDAIDVELTITNPRRDCRARMPDQENLHKRPQ